MSNFSVLMSVYIKTNLRQLEECLVSINNQTLLPSEIIIIRDGKVDFDLESILFKYNKLKFVVVINENNLGLPKSLNKGLDYCKNEIIFRMDSDDICHNERFSIQLDKMLSNDRLAVLGTNVELIDNFSLIMPNIRKVPVLDVDIRRIMFFKNPFNHPSVVFRKSIVQSVGGYTDIYLYEDWYLWIKLSQIENIEFENLNQKLLKYRIRSFYDRTGFTIVKAEYKFYLLLFKNNFIKWDVFISNIGSKFVIRMMPDFFYKIVKHRFDKIN
jgi:amylovoran biosynthesis glycosyltransferase AmsE